MLEGGECGGRDASGRDWAGDCDHPVNVNSSGVTWGQIVRWGVTGREAEGETVWVDRV